jgi:hypothetical protein
MLSPMRAIPDSRNVWVTRAHRAFRYVLIRESMCQSAQRRAGNPANPASMTAGQGIRGANHGSQCPDSPGLTGTPRDESAGGDSPPDSLRPAQTPDSCMGVKGSPVQIRPSRPLHCRSEGVSGLSPGPLPISGASRSLDPTSPTPATSRPLRRYLTGPLAEPPRRGWLRRRRFSGSDSCHGCPLLSCRGTLRTRATVSSLLSPPLKASTAC